MATSTTVSTGRPSAAASRGKFSAAWLTVATLAAGLINYGYSLALTHFLQPAAFAQFAGAQALVLLVGVIGGVGVPYVVAQEVRSATSTGESNRFADAVSFAFWANALTGAAAAVLVALLTLRFGTPGDATLVACTVFSLAVGSTSLGVFQGRGDTTIAAAVITGEVALKLLVGLTLVVVVAARAGSALAGLLCGSLVLVASSAPYWKYIGSPRRAAAFRPLIASSLQIGAVQLGVGIIATLDTYLVATTKHYESAAAYQVAATFGKATLFVSAAVSFAKFPLLNEPDAISHRVHALRSYVLLAGAATIGLLTIPRTVLHIVLPTSYLDVGSWLHYTALFGFGIGLANLFTTFVQSYQRPGSPLAVRHAVLMLPLCGTGVVAMVLGALFVGVRGVAIAAVASAWLIAVVYGSMPRERAALRMFADALRGARLRVLLVVVVAAGMFFTANIPSLWFANAAVLAGCAVWFGFPERGTRQRRQGPTG